MMVIDCVMVNRLGLEKVTCMPKETVVPVTDDVRETTDGSLLIGHF